MNAKLWKLRMPRDREKLEKRRIEAVKLVRSGEKTPSEVARDMGVNRTTVQAWLKAYRDAGGGRGLRAKPRPGRSPFLTPQQSQKLLQYLMEGALQHGFDTDLWTSARVKALIERKFGVCHGVSSIPWVLRRLGLSPQKPESRAIERDEKAIRGWVRKDFERIKKGPQAGGHPGLHR
jgi:transposase